MPDEPFKSYQKVSCLCGASLRVDPSNTNRHVACPTCGNSFDVVVTMDAAKRRSKVSIVLSKAAMKTEGDSLGKAGDEPVQAGKAPGAKGTPPPKAEPTPTPAKPMPKVTRVTRKVGGKTTKAIMGNCECGAAFPLEDTDELTILQTCPQCNTLYHVVFKLEPGTHQKTAMLVPERPKLPKSRTIAQRPAPPLFPEGGTPSPDDLRVTDFFTPAKKGRTRISKSKVSNTKSKAPKPPPEIPPGAQGVPCSCGTIFVVRRKDLAGELACEGCGKTAKFEETRDPQSLAPVIRVRKE